MINLCFVIILLPAFIKSFSFYFLIFNSLFFFMSQVRVCWTNLVRSTSPSPFNSGSCLLTQNYFRASSRAFFVYSIIFYSNSISSSFNGWSPKYCINFIYFSLSSSWIFENWPIYSLYPYFLIVPSNFSIWVIDKFWLIVFVPFFNNLG